ncbi:MAG: YifB family Mg chelatase-like AAA ATPase [Epsilonproteobacteria bacterium]|nr:YifB family Mg chelatase-like AAA ATPase [Campylobacterota bacterium]
MEKETKTKKINSAIFDGEVHYVEVETTFIKALPSFSIVGLAGNAVQESKERIKAALMNNDFTFPPLKIITNLSPANLPKKSTALDLPIALTILFQNRDVDWSEYLVLGELGLDGSIKATNDMFAIVLGSKYKKIIAPMEIATTLAKIPDKEIYGFENISEFFDLKLTPIASSQIDYKSIVIDDKKYFYNDEFVLDFSDVKGQEAAKRVALISAAGMHNVLFEGSAGVGKSMIINRLRYILPPVSLEELLEIQKQYALEGRDIDFNPVRPFRMPHHSSSKAAIFGGRQKIGEIALANNGILFFDELPQFRRDILEDLRLPLQEGKVLISRVDSKIEYKTNILFAAAMNPCPCGNLLSQKECRCSDLEIKRYKNRISEPLIDRIDLYFQLSEDFSNSTISSQEMYHKVLIAFEKQAKRGYLNSRLPDNWEFDLSSDARDILKKAINSYNLSKRSELKILKVARTIADLNEHDKIDKIDIIEAIGYRKR